MTRWEASREDLHPCTHSRFGVCERTGSADLTTTFGSRDESSCPSTSSQAARDGKPDIGSTRFRPRCCASDGPRTCARVLARPVRGHRSDCLSGTVPSRCCQHWCGGGMRDRPDPERMAKGGGGVRGRAAWLPREPRCFFLDLRPRPGQWHRRNAGPPRSIDKRGLRQARGKQGDRLSSLPPLQTRRPGEGTIGQLAYSYHERGNSGRGHGTSHRSLPPPFHLMSLHQFVALSVAQWPRSALLRGIHTSYAGQSRTATGCAHPGIAPCAVTCHPVVALGDGSGDRRASSGECACLLDGAHTPAVTFPPTGVHCWHWLRGPPCKSPLGRPSKRSRSRDELSTSIPCLLH